MISREEKIELAWSFWQLQNEHRPDDATALLHPNGGYRTFHLPNHEALHDQRYCMWMTLRDGLISMINEYLDTKKEDPLITFVLAEMEHRDGARARA